MSPLVIVNIYCLKQNAYITLYITTCNLLQGWNSCLMVRPHQWHNKQHKTEPIIVHKFRG
ncbi:hypothetical protein LXL04_010802 [Taraxacum kok-saghyz]